MIASGGRRVAGWAAVVAGLGASAAGVVLAVQAAHPPADVGTLPAAAPSAAAPAAPRPGSSPPAPEPPLSSVPRPPIEADWAVPTRVTVGALHVDAPVRAVGVQPDGALTVPDDGADLGWWLGSATPGAPRGTVLIAGHVDTAADGPGALFRLETMRMGTSIAVRAGDRTVLYRAVARRSYAKQHLPAALFRTGTPPQLALVTCGGTFHNGTYSHNVVVYAEPIAG